MNSGPVPRSVIVATRLYRWLLCAYPPEFRRTFGSEMIQVFVAMSRRAASLRGASGLLWLLCHTSFDLATSVSFEHFYAWRKTMQRQNSAALITGSAFLVIPGLFIILNVLQYNLGVNLPWDPFDALYASARTPLARYALDAVIVLSPAVALFALFLPNVRITLGSSEANPDQMASLAIRKGSRATLILIGLCMLVAVIFTVYFIGENLPCLLGQQPTCGPIRL